MKAADTKVPGTSVLLARFKLLVYFLTILPIACFWYLIFAYSVNFPMLDDFIFLELPLNFLKAQRFGEWFNLIFGQFTDHRPAFLRIINLIFYYLTGHVDFRVLAAVGNCFFLALMVVLYKSWDLTENKLLYFAPVVFIVFQPQLVESMFFAGTALSSGPVLCFAFASIFLVKEKTKPAFAISALFAVLAAYTLGNGVFVFPINLAMLVIQKRYKYAAIWLAISLAVLGPYFYDYHKFGSHPEYVTPFSNPKLFATFFFTLVGLSLYPFHIPAGLLVCGFFAYLLARRFYRVNQVIFFCFLFVFASLLTATLARASFGVEWAVGVSRYKNTSVLLLALCYLAFLSMLGRERRKRWVPALLALSIIFNLASYFYAMKQVELWEDRLTISYLRWQHEGRGLLLPNDTYAAQLIRESERKGFYKPPVDSEQRGAPIENVSLPAKTRNLGLSIDALEDHIFFSDVQGTNTGSENTSGANVFIVLESRGKTYLFEAFLGHRRFWALVLKEYLPPGRYRVGIYVKREHHEGLQYTDKVINVLDASAIQNGIWCLDSNGNGVWEGCSVDRCYNFGLATDVPLTGDWNGNGRTTIGVFRNGTWYLDYNGDGAWSGCAVDKCYSFGLATDVPVVGDWNGDGKTKIGVFRNGTWALDMNGNGVWEGCSVDRCYNFGLATDVPLTGDWNGSGTTKIGVFRNGAWMLDYNGNGVWDGCTADRCYNFGLATDVPVTGDWNGDRKSEIGVFRNGTWSLDINGNGRWDGPLQKDSLFNFGLAADVPVTGDWNGDGKSEIGVIQSTDSRSQ